MAGRPKVKGHWPKGRRRHPEPADLAALLRDLDSAARRRLGRRVARRAGVHVDTLRRWRRRIDIPHPDRARRTRAALAAIWIKV